jgi:hypothetical protein
MLVHPLAIAPQPFSDVGRIVERRAGIRRLASPPTSVPSACTLISQVKKLVRG